MSEAENSSSPVRLDFLRRMCVIGLAAVGLSGCLGSNLGSGPVTSPGEMIKTSGQVIGSGSVRVGLLLPLSGEGKASSVGDVFRKSAELALANFPNADIQLLVKDTKGTASGGRIAAQSAVSEGAELILGPVFSGAVAGASAVSKTAGVPIVAFSSDVSVAGRNTYLLSFLPQTDVKRIIDYAKTQRRRSFAALVPDDTYGAVVEASFRQEVGRIGGRIASIQRYSVAGGNTSDLIAKSQALAASIKQVDSLFIPAGNVAPAVLQTLASAGADIKRIKVLGSGQWETPAVKTNNILAGSWYPGPDNTGFNAFAQRYKATYGSIPPRNATLVYDGVTLAAGLVRSAGSQRFSAGVMTNREGFIGIDGLFRLRADGRNERGLAVYQLTGQGVQTISAAPRSFGSRR